jgi:lysophospholipase L1-like esterase
MSGPSAEVTSDAVPSAKTSVGLAAALLLTLGALLGVRAAFGDDQDRDDVGSLRLVGDSFPEQSRDQLLAHAARQGIDADVSAFGGTSICSWWERIDEYAADEPDVLIVAFAGNDMHECITDDPAQQRTPEEVAADYRADLDTLLEKFESLDTEIYVVLPPPVGLDVFEERAEAIRDMYREVPADHPDVGVIDSATHLDPDGQGFQPVLPCEAWDDCGDESEIKVRDDDTIHFTEAGGERYARAILEAVGVL